MSISLLFACLLIIANLKQIKPKTEICKITTFEQKLMKKNNLPPNVSSIASRTTKQEKEVKFRVKIMKDLYNILSSDLHLSYRRKRASFLIPSLSKVDIDIAENSDQIITLGNKNENINIMYRKQKLEFSMKGVTLPSSPESVKAELKFYQNGTNSMNSSEYLYNLNIFGFFNHKLKKFAQKTIMSNYKGWLSIDISYLLQIWLKNFKKNHQIFISAEPVQPESSNSKEFHPSLIGIEFQGVNELFIMAFLPQSDNFNTLIPDQLPKFVPNYTKRSTLSDIVNPVQETRDCTLYHLMVNFEVLGWEYLVIAPQEYPSALCVGSCNFPFKKPLEVSDRAIVQNFMHMKFPDLYPKPTTCAPSHYTSLSVLLEKDRNTIQQKFKNMIATKCMCH